MKKTLTLFLMLIVGIVSSWAQLPEFSTEDNPVYYKVNFIQGSTFLQDNGSGTFLTNENASANVGQLFAFVGTQNNFKLLSKLGNYVTTKQVSRHSYSIAPPRAMIFRLWILPSKMVAS